MARAVLWPEWSDSQNTGALLRLILNLLASPNPDLHQPYALEIQYQFSGQEQKDILIIKLITMGSPAVTNACKQY